MERRTSGGNRMNKIEIYIIVKRIREKMKEIDDLLTRLNTLAISK